MGALYRQTRRSVWKFPLSIGDITTINVATQTLPCLVGLDPASGGPAIWLEVEPDGEPRERRFVIYGTGHPIEGDGGYPYDLHIGSLIQNAFVWHIYERRLP
jgi:hypothetical protein